MACGIHITDIEAAINYWRGCTVTDGIALAPEVAALAEVYAAMVYRHETEFAPGRMSRPAYDAWLAWYRTMPDTPCIAICSTGQGDAVCRGCGRTFAEVQRWTGMTPVEKRATWRRITVEGRALRFTRYRERA